MIVKCLKCYKEFNKLPSQIKRSPNNFCSRKCAASYNNSISPKIKKKYYFCKDCGDKLSTRRTFKCANCHFKNGNIGDKTIKELIYTEHHKSSAYALIRSRARAIAKKLGWKSCSKCGYDKHIEIAHIKAISDFDEDTLCSVVNNESNLLPLCPNCHWEFDNLARVEGVEPT